MIVRIIRAKSVQRYNPQELVLLSPIKITRLNHPQEDPENSDSSCGIIFFPFSVRQRIRSCRSVIHVVCTYFVQSITRPSPEPALCIHRTQ